MHDQWGITDIQCKCDLLTLGNSLDNEYASHLLSGKSLPINFSTRNHTTQSTNGDKDFSAHISRALTRLKSVLLTLNNTSLDTALYKEANGFYHPMSGSWQGETHDFRYEHQCWLQTGSMQLPVYPINSVAEAYYQLKKVVGKALFILVGTALKGILLG